MMLAWHSLTAEDLFGVVCITLWLTDGDSRGLICYRFIVLLFFS